MSGQLLSEKRVALLTYNKPHRKTQDVALRLFQAGFRNVEVVATRWIDREGITMLYPQRPGDRGWPDQPLDVPPRKFFENFGWDYVETDREDLDSCLVETQPDVVVVGGAGLMGPDVTEKYLVVNSHPGYLPFTRGLDTIKWGILLGLPIGVSTHILDSRADAGRLIHQCICPLTATDDFTRYASRLYDLEMSMLVPAVFTVLASGRREDFPAIDIEGYPAYRRMGKRKEREMIKELEVWKLSGKQPGANLMMFALPPCPWPDKS